MPRRALALAALTLAVGLLSVVPASAGAQAPVVPPSGTLPASVPAFDGDAMWIWLMTRSEGGSATRIAARAKRSGLELVILKAGNERTQWTQLNPSFVRTLHASGIRACGYHFVYGRHPIAEARLSARIARTGADCLVIDAESDYKGRYREAELYMRELRRLVGPDYPIGLTSFPYVHYHSTLPYSVFLGPRGADFNVPQMYWRAIGTSVDSIFQITYMHNRIYKRPIYPLGQVWMHPRPTEIRRFRALAAAYGATGVSWWSWQEGIARDFTAIGAPLPRLLAKPRDPGYPLVTRLWRGDIVVQVQQLLLAAGAKLRVTGRMDLTTRRAVAAFKRARGLGVNSVVTAAAWRALLSYEPAPVTWRARTYGLPLAPTAAR
ncbi:MAG TPA: peptidoglycan-binding protein [Thermoleophilaceae bacterium]|nr:peptidoglycan-binding protein [Thermoleophilaceae bacterium]